MKRLPGSRKTVFRRSLPSTQDAAAELERAGAPDRTFVAAASQSAGRGSGKRVWFSDPGGVYFTWLFRASLRKPDLQALSWNVAASLATLLTRLCGVDTRVKAPNDILAAEPGSHDFKKIGGILIEASHRGKEMRTLRVGVGLNVNNPLSPALPNATSLHLLTGRRRSELRILRRAASCVRLEVEAWKSATASPS